MKSIKLLAILFIATLTFTACSDDENPMEEVEEEVITTMKIPLTPDGGGTSVTMESKDLDGDGPNLPEITGAILSANTTYNASITLSNETESPAEDITAEVREKDEEHQFFYQVSSSLNATAAYAGSNDSNGNPVGLNFTLTTTDASNGGIIVTLRHEPNKSASGVKNGDITNADGETDIEVTFPVTIQ